MKELLIYITPLFPSTLYLLLAPSSNNSMEEKSSEGEEDSVTKDSNQNNEMDVSSAYKEWKNRIEAAQTPEEAACWFCDGTGYENIETEFRAYHDHNIVIDSVTWCCEIEGKQILLVRGKADGEAIKMAYAFDNTDENGFRYYVDDTLVERMENEIVCHHCSGSGQVSSNGSAMSCGICGGSGQQYIPNLYFDQIMGWQGGYVCCSGCGGSGVTNVSWSTCPFCEGSGLRY